MEKVIKKQDIQEIIDDEGNLIGTADTPDVGNNKDTEASHTTDYNAKVHSQNYKNDFLGRFGFYFYESEGQDKPEIVEELEYVVGDKKAKEVMSTIKPFLEEALDSMGGFLTEAKVAEDKLTKKKENEFVKKETNDMSKRVERVADLLSKLPKNDLDKLMNLLESKKGENVVTPESLKKKMEGVGLKKDKDGYFVTTHRARSKSYESPEKIPDSEIKRIETTG